MKDKLVKEDIGMVDDMFELCKNLTSIESHAFGSYVSSKKEIWMYISKKARELRTKYLSLITQNEEQSWCISKHISECCMRLQEIYTRFISTKQYQEASIVAEDYMNLYDLFMEINKYGEKNVSTNSSA